MIDNFISSISKRNMYIIYCTFLLFFSKPFPTPGYVGIEGPPCGTNFLIINNPFKPAVENERCPIPSAKKGYNSSIVLQIIRKANWHLSYKILDDNCVK